MCGVWEKKFNTAIRPFILRKRRNDKRSENESAEPIQDVTTKPQDYKFESTPNHTILHVLRSIIYSSPKDIAVDEFLFACSIALEPLVVVSFKTVG